MSYTTIHRPNVFWDITDALEYYKAISPKLAAQFLFKLKEAIINIERNPLGFLNKISGGKNFNAKAISL